MMALMLRYERKRSHRDPGWRSRESLSTLERFVGLAFPQ